MSGEAVVRFELYPRYSISHLQREMHVLAAMQANGVSTSSLRRVGWRLESVGAARMAERLRCLRQASPLFHAQAGEVIDEHFGRNHRVQTVLNVRSVARPGWSNRFCSRPPIKKKVHSCH
jgi:hypothetical protein